MATDTEQLVVALEARVRDFEKNFDKAVQKSGASWSKIEQRSAQASRRIESEFRGVPNRLAGEFEGMGKRLVGALSVAAITQAAGAIRGLVKSAADMADLADKIGVSAEALQAYQFAAEMSGSETDAMNKALLLFSRNLGEASRGQGELLKLFTANGIAIKDASGNLRPFADLLGDFAEMAKNARNESERMSIAQMGMGRAGADVVLTLAQGRQGLADLAQQARDTGNIMGEKLVRDAAELDDTLNVVVNGGMTRMKSATLGVVSAVAELVSGIGELLGKLEQLGGIEFAPSFWQALGALPGLSGIAAGRNMLFPESPFGITIPPQPQTVAGGKSDFITELPTSGGKASTGKSKTASLKAVKDAYAEVRKSLMAYIAAQQIELDTFGQSAAAAASYKLEQEAINRATAAGIILTPQQREEIAALAQTYGDLIARTEAAEKSQDKLNDARDTIRELGRSNLTSFIDDLKAGTSWAQALAQSLARVAEQLMQIAINSLFDSSAGTNLFTGVAKFLGFSRGGPVEGPGTGTSDSIPAYLSDGEFVVRADQAKKHRALLDAINSGKVPAFAKGGLVAGLKIPAMPRMAAAGGSPVFNISTPVSVNAFGGTAAENQELAEKTARAVERTIRGIVQKELVKQLRPGNLLWSAANGMM